MATSTVDPKSPLLLLDNDQYNYTSYKFPAELGTDPGLNHWILFHVNQSTDTKFKTINTTNPDLGPTEIPTINRVTQNDTTINSRQNISRTPASVALYMPPDLNTTYAADWSSQDLGTPGDILRDLGLNSDMGMFRDAIVNAARGITPDNIAGTLGQQQRKAANNHKEVLFDGIPFRQFEFQFQMIPKNSEEAKIIDNIIKLFKFYSAPEINGIGPTGRFWIYPAEFDIEFYSDGVVNTFINKISTCALTSMNVNYTGGSTNWSAHRDGSPMQTNLSLKFMELELIDKNRILTGNF